MNPIAIIQARTGSTRLPNKVLAPLANNRSVLAYVIERCRRSQRLNRVVVATTTKVADDPIVNLACSMEVPVYRGSETDVLARYVEAALQAQADPIIRITGDCPLVDPAIIDSIIDLYVEAPADYVFIQGYPRGVDGAELMTLAALQRTLQETGPEDTYYREHVMTYLVDHPEKFKLNIREAPAQFQRPDVRLCIDEATDLEVVQNICRHFAPRLDFMLAEILMYLQAHPEIADLNRHVKQKVR